MPLASAVACERLLELRLSWKNARWAKARGDVEYGQRHFPCMVAARIGLFIGILTEVALAHRHFIPVLGRIALGVQAVVHAGRWWCARSLGPRWNTHVIVVPGMPLVDRGPYRWLRHPNHMVVVAEGIALPLVHSAWLTALLFTAADAAVLTVRLRVENKALGLATQVRVAGCRRCQVAPVSPCGGATRLVQPLVQGARPPRLGHDLADSSRTPDGGPGRVGVRRKARGVARRPRHSEEEPCGRPGRPEPRPR
ncbi:isoprenylcysteine carboxyl methyltransferase (ICMT) family protein [Streptomyces ipomoeae 91-03]|uniref:Isoprenylcysteine carboxyl methyltransferase (ICMT) family protein n=1 Tax=Streptomyces ipomoeae 91-03 TaxID=698759 RepID=L1L543_9ACTN|nr:isoprenylcysteine carboxyl methyltransferase (ICMT) family protein [Streptomyces ipomoeae 91-03]TQE37058.1 hypothetical protein Sipo7851_10215 [Streptomyces ipomoeae]